jgi:hypothetical protein
MYNQYLFDEGVFYHHGPLNLTTILHLFLSIKLAIIGIIYNKEVGNFIELAKFELKLEKSTTKKPTTSSSSNHVVDSM